MIFTQWLRILRRKNKPMVLGIFNYTNPFERIGIFLKFWLVKIYVFVVSSILVILDSILSLIKYVRKRLHIQKKFTW